MPEPIVFVSYSHDSPAHKEWVLRLATDLRTRGIDAILDQWDLQPGQDTVAFMEQSIARSDRVLLICTDPYVDKADSVSGGVGYERLVITGELVEQIDTKKFIPLIRQLEGKSRLPRYLGRRLFIDFREDSKYQDSVDELVREIHGAPRSAKPPLGPNPFAGTPPTSTGTPRRVEPAGSDESGHSVLKEQWFNNQLALARDGLTRLGRKGAMEIRSALHEPIAKSQLELLNAVRKAQIRTFGWPIGIVLDNRDEYRPRPVQDGVMAEVAITEKGLSGTTSYDYWMARTNGDFYLLQSLFEDERGKDVLFFDTRIVRVTESLLFLSGFYETLGVPLETRVTVSITHMGMDGRTLTSAGQRYVSPRKTTNAISEAQITDTVLGLRMNTATNVKRILEPMFMLFDFAEFNQRIYDDITAKFALGHIG